MEVKVTATLGNTLYQTEVKTDKHRIISDEPQDLGGGDTGMNPFELLASALATCTAATLRMYMNRKQWQADEIVVLVELIEDKPNKTTKFKREIQFVGTSLDDDQKKRLLITAEKCPVHKVLTGNVAIATAIND